MILDRVKTIDPTIFRAYDIRGIVGKTLTEESVFLIGKALGSMLLDLNKDQLIMARDGRTSSPELANALCDGILSTGCNVTDLGMAPTPILYYATHVLEHSSGVMLTGSHNPTNYNGLKMVIDHTALTEAGIHNLYERIIAKRFYKGRGVVQLQFDLMNQYIDYMAHNVRLARPLKVVIDAGNGVAGMIAPRLFRTLGCEVHELFCDVNGHFPNHHPDPSEAKNLQDLIHAVREKKADMGLAFDGDGDRLGVVTNQGNIIWSDRLLMLYAQSILAKHPQSKIIFDVKCTSHLATQIRALGGEPIMWKTGHSFIKAKLTELDGILAGEMSGHFFFKDRWFGFDDALYAGARLLEILSQQVLDSDTLFAGIPNSINTPELKIPVAETEKYSLMQKLIAKANFADAELLTIDGLRVNFAEGWGLLRPSNTTPCLILRFEALNEVMLKKIQNLFKDWILSVQPDLVLPF